MSAARRHGEHQLRGGGDLAGVGGGVAAQLGQAGHAHQGVGQQSGLQPRHPEPGPGPAPALAQPAHSQLQVAAEVGGALVPELPRPRHQAVHHQELGVQRHLLVKHPLQMTNMKC